MSSPLRPCQGGCGRKVAPPARKCPTCKKQSRRIARRRRGGSLGRHSGFSLYQSTNDQSTEPAAVNPSACPPAAEECSLAPSLPRSLAPSLPRSLAPSPDPELSALEETAAAWQQHRADWIAAHPNSPLPCPDTPAVFDLEDALADMREAGEPDCIHPPQSLYSWFAHDKTLCVACRDCGGVLRGEV